MNPLGCLLKVLLVVGAMACVAKWDLKAIGWLALAWVAITLLEIALPGKEPR